MSEIVEGLMRPEEYRAARPQLYPSEQSLLWFMRRNREELVSAGAIIIPNGRWLVCPQEFDQAVIDIGQRRARGY